MQRKIGEGDLVQVTGPGAGEPVLVSRKWLTDTMRTSTAQVAPCHPVTGALLDHLPPRNRTITTTTTTTRTDVAHRAGHVDPVVAVVAAAAGIGAYTPTAAMAKRIRSRDRRCRFPGCSIAAVFCDLDHVRPWPAGPTRDDNLLTLCRRHHRVKQRPGWAVTLTPDAVATWTDPTARVRTSHPVDALTSVVLTGPAGDTGPPSTSRTRTLIPDGPHSELEYHLEHHAAPARGRQPAPPPTWRDHQGQTHRVDLPPAVATIAVDHDTWPCRPARYRTRRPHDLDQPPF